VTRTPPGALQHALDLAEPDQGLFSFLSHPPPGPPDRQEGHLSVDGNLICHTTDVLAGGDRPASPPPPQTRHLETLTHGETRVLRYLPTNLTAREIARGLYLSVNTVKTHQRHLYQKLGAQPYRGRRTGPRSRPARIVPTRLLP
jgi:LuxR family transcriptional regulator, maltose regulon positive regulatory protein